jgi:hypothetical protein
VGLSFLLELFGGRRDNGLFGYLKSRDANKTRRMIEQDRNKTEMEIRKDWSRALIELERERRITSQELIKQLPEGSTFSESTIVGKREIQKAQVQPVSLLVLPKTGGEQHQEPLEQVELPAPQAPALEQDVGLE